MRLASDSSMVFVDLQKDQIFDWENKKTFFIEHSLEYQERIYWKIDYEETLFNQYIHVFDEIEEDLFQYLGPARLKVKETKVQEPNEEYKTWLYTFEIEGNLLDSESIVDTSSETSTANREVEKNIPENLKGFEREAIIKARINQSGFRQNLIRKYGKCCLCGVESTTLLLASHIKPWKDSNEDEKGDTSNGLLLCPNHDKLFDRGLISFDDDGAILISEKLSDNDQMFMNVKNGMTIQVDPDMKKYLKFHRENCFRK